MRIELTSNVFYGDDWQEKLDECRACAARYGFEFGVQLHNSASNDMVERLTGADVPLSAHLPVNGEILLNLATKDVSAAWKEFERQALFCHANGVKRGVFHGFFMTDLPILNFGPHLNYDAALGRICRPELALLPGSRLNRNFADLLEYGVRQSLLRENLARLRERFPDLCFCIENDFPAYSSGNMLPEEMAKLDHFYCLDTSHLWAACHLFGRDFHQEAETLLATGRVRMVHLHASPYGAQTPQGKWSDGHLPLATPNEMNLPLLIRRFAAYGVDLIVLEIPAGTVADIEYTGNILSGKEAAHESGKEASHRTGDKG